MKSRNFPFLVAAEDEALVMAFATDFIVEEEPAAVAIPARTDGG